MPHWKHNATRCAVEGCDRQRRKGWSTCSQIDHDGLGQALYGAGRISAIPASVATQFTERRLERVRRVRAEA